MNKDTPSSDASGVQYLEIVFSFVMGVIALLCRGNPLVSSGILWAFAAMLALNLVSHRALRAGRGPAAPLVSIAVNTMLSSAAVALSGGQASSFWPLYLLPIFTACLQLERRHVAGAWLASAAFLACFYIEGFWEQRRWDAAEFLIKLGVLAFAAAVTSRLSFKERAHREAFAAARARMDALSRTLERRTATELMELRRQSLGTLVPGIVHALQNPLTVVLGTVELMLREAPAGSPLRADLERIRGAARRCALVGEDLMAHARAEGMGAR